MPLHPQLQQWLAKRNWTPFQFQQDTWNAYLASNSGLVHAPTGQGKTLAVWLGPLSQYLNEHPQTSNNPDNQSTANDNNNNSTHPKPKSNSKSTTNRDLAPPIRVLWVTPLRALASDTVQSLLEPIQDLNLPWTVEKRTGDTPASLRAKQRKKLPTALVTTPESLSILLSYKDAKQLLKSIRCVVVDEWHELMSTKRGTQTELCLARLRNLAPNLQTWGLSATLGNLDEAAACLVGTHTQPKLIAGNEPKSINVQTILPKDPTRFPWAGHLGIALIDEVIDAIEQCAASKGTTLLFCNTRSQCEIWFTELLKKRPDWIGKLAIHHGSIDRDIRERVEHALRTGHFDSIDLQTGELTQDALKCVVCTSSLDLGVDFSPVEQVIQVGSPKGVARLMQRAGRSGHQPGALSKVLCAPAHAFELIEFSAARTAITDRAIEPRTPLNEPLDVLAQHLVTVATGEGFNEEHMLQEVRSAHSYRNLTNERWQWVMEFVEMGGQSLSAYEGFKRVNKQPDNTLKVTDNKIARAHRMAIGTITSESAMTVAYANGKTLGTIEESFISRLRKGDRFVFAGRVLELLRVRAMTAQVTRAKSTKGIVPRWDGGRTPLSTLLSERVRNRLTQQPTDPEMQSVQPLLHVQKQWSILPSHTQLLIEAHTTRDGSHIMIFPFEGRLVHEGLGALLAHRIAQAQPITLTVTVNDYGVELASPTTINPDQLDWQSLLSEHNLLNDLLTCLNSNELARRRFRDIARIAGLIQVGFPGQSKSTRQLQASSELFFDVFLQFDPDNMLLDQARREVLEEQLEVERLRAALQRIATQSPIIKHPPRLTPLAFPLWAESLRTQHISSESWRDQITRMATQLEAAADQHTPN